MKMFRRIFYFLRRTFEHFVENPFLNLVTVTIIATTLFLGSLFLLFMTNLNHLFDLWGKGIQVVAYLNPSLTGSEQTQLQKLIESQIQIEKVSFVSKARALVRFKQMLRGNAQIVKDLDRHNPLPASFEIDLKREFRAGEQMQVFSQWLSARKGVEEVVYGQEWVSRFATILSLLRILGSLLGAILLLAALFIVSNTIKVTLFARKRELEIMQLVGATDWFIEIPYVLEGSIQGFVGSLLAILGSYLLYQTVMGRLTLIFSMPEFPFLTPSMTLAIMAGGILVGAMASFISVNRFLKHG